MPQIFSKKANLIPAVSLVAGLFASVFILLLIWYYFSPEFTDVGYAPEQPVQYSHRLHAGQLGMDCQYCHTSVQSAAHSNIPATETCMNCHAQIKRESLLLVPVRESWATGKSIEWIKVHHLPDYAQFSHAVHVNNGVGCETCHGRIDQMEIVAQAEPLSMGWCLECHRQPELFLRPDDAVTKMGYVQPADFVKRNLERIRLEGIQPPENCSACHY